jgi:hypothetical protein
MKSLSLESIHYNIQKQILLAESYTECSGLSFIIKSCRLIPKDYLENRNPKIVLKDHWVDEFGNSLRIVKNKKIKLIYNDLSLDRSKINCTDMYYGLSLENVIKISKLAYLCAGFDDDTLEERNYICLLGIDNYFRTYLFDGEWVQISTLHLGMTNLKLIAKGVDIKYFLDFSNLKNMPFPCVRANQWLTILPPNVACLDAIKKDYPNLSSVVVPKE